MSLLNYLQSLPVIQWAILLLSASSLVLTLTLAVRTLILPLFSTLTKSQKKSLQSFLMTSEEFLTSNLPILSVALKTALTKKSLLPMQDQKSPEQTTQDQTQEPEQTTQDLNDPLENFISFIQAFKEVKK